MKNNLKFMSKFPVWIWSSCRYYSQRNLQTHYEILNLNRNCTPDEVRSAFIKLSKQYHPDTKGAQNDPNITAKFVKIREAYQVLSKNATRESYDQDLFARGMSSSRMESSPNSYSTIHKPWQIKPDYNPNPGPYYGFDGVKRVSNYRIVGIIVFFVITGTAFEFFLVRHSFTFNRGRLDDVSKEASNKHEAVRADAKKYGNEKQIERMAEKMLKGLN